MLTVLQCWFVTLFIAPFLIVLPPLPQPRDVLFLPS